MANQFVIKINTDRNGREVSLANMSIDAVEALNIFLESLKDFAKLHDNQNVRFTLKDGCIETGIEYPETDVDIDKEIKELLEGTSENNGYIKIFKSIQDKVKQNGLDYSILHKVKDIEENVTEIFKAKNFSYKREPRKEWNEEIVFIEGTLFDAGGKVKSNIHIETADEEFKIDCTREQAAIVPVYNKVYVAAVKSWKEGGKPSYSFVDSYLKPELFNHYKSFYTQIHEDTSLQKYDTIHNTIVEIITDSEQKIGTVLKIMRLYNFDFSDRGIIRTILMALKPFKSDKKIAEMYQELADTLREGNKNNVI